MNRLFILLALLVATVSAQTVVPTIITTQSDGTGQPSYALALVETGKLVTLSANATGSALQYQWLKNSVAIPGATSPSLVFNKTLATDTGYYSVRIGSGSSYVTSIPKPLSVVSPQPPPVIAPTIKGTAAAGDPQLAPFAPQLAYQTSVTASDPRGISQTVYIVRDPVTGALDAAWAYSAQYPSVSKRGDYWAVLYVLYANPSPFLGRQALVQSETMFQLNGKDQLTFNTTKNSTTTVLEVVYLTAQQPTISKRGNVYLTVIAPQ